MLNNILQRSPLWAVLFSLYQISVKHKEEYDEWAKKKTDKQTNVLFSPFLHIYFPLTANKYCSCNCLNQYR